ncbi:MULTISPECIES: carboxy-S-adenosyl-L-methionine synthase CmoA [Olivibacter]|uniref:Carboxy-S-adenosyl-L-methionine synthase n=1 Tax=Olivibacter oleidegradans TaxID=760123 RepID=A0ABV6HIK4_9SPHI|nr:carboxy-S-adenosyl-L-methionine synthase CmoA [Olivibacter jilunii]
MEKDKIFEEKKLGGQDFKFGEKVVQVFDDMVSRSVPLYPEIQRMVAELAATYSMEGTDIYDMGCSTGTTFLALDPIVPESVSFVGIDNSQEMLDKCEQRFREKNIKRIYTLKYADLNGTVSVSNASIVIMCLTLQFVRPMNRQRMLESIFEGVIPGGCVLLVEKVLAEDSDFNRDFIDFYYQMKRRNDYSDLEIARKREALENVLVPYKTSENIAMLRQVGFSRCEIFFKWYNFVGIIAKKGI